MLTLASALGVLVLRASPAFRPLLLAMLAQLLLDGLGAAGNARVQLATLVLCPTASGLGVQRAFRARSPIGDIALLVAGLALAGAALFAPAGPWWAWAWPASLGVCVCVEGVSWARWRASQQTPGVAQRVAELLTGLDAAALGLGLWLGWSGLGAWGEAQAFGVAAVELLYLVRLLDAVNAASQRDSLARFAASNEGRKQEAHPHRFTGSLRKTPAQTQEE